MSRKLLEAGFLRMSSDRPTCGKRLVATAALAAFVLMAFGSGCTGFFVNQPNSIAVTQGSSSTLAVAAGTPQQLTATATYNSGTKIVTNSASWSSSTSCATVSTTGVVTAVGPSSSVTITAKLAGVQGTITGSTTGGSAQTLSISSNPMGTTFGVSTTATFTATLNNADVTSLTTWSSSDTSVVSFSGNTATFAATAGTAMITASYAVSGTCATGSESITVQ